MNSLGAFNTPMGDYANPTICAPTVLRESSDALRVAHLTSGDFVRAVSGVEVNDLVFMDSPYDPVSETANFTSYQGRFGKLEQKILSLVAADLVDRRAFVMLTNSDTKFIRSLYPKSSGFRIDRVKAKRSINSNIAKRGAVNEVIITGGYKIPRSRRASQ